MSGTYGVKILKKEPKKRLVTNKKIVTEKLAFARSGITTTNCSSIMKKYWPGQPKPLKCLVIMLNAVTLFKSTVKIKYTELQKKKKRNQ